MPRGALLASEAACLSVTEVSGFNQELQELKATAEMIGTHAGVGKLRDKRHAPLEQHNVFLSTF
jgi:hypothetical protein